MAALEIGTGMGGTGVRKIEKTDDSYDTVVREPKKSEASPMSPGQTGSGLTVGLGKAAGSLSSQCCGVVTQSGGTGRNIHRVRSYAREERWLPRPQTRA